MARLKLKSTSPPPKHSPTGQLRRSSRLKGAPKARQIPRRNNSERTEDEPSSSDHTELSDQEIDEDSASELEMNFEKMSVKELNDYLRSCEALPKGNLSKTRLKELCYQGLNLWEPDGSGLLD